MDTRTSHDEPRTPLSNPDLRPEPAPISATTDVAVDRLAALTTGLVGIDYLETVTHELSRILDVEWVLVAEIDGDHSVSRAIAKNGEPCEHLRYSLVDTPCQRVTEGDTCFVESGAQDRFPGDSLIRELGIEAYFGVPLFDTRGSPIGVMAGLSRVPCTAGLQVRTVFRIFGARAAVELERVRREAERQELEAELERARKLEALGRVAGGAAHDFNNLLMAMTGLAQVGLMGTGEEAREALQDVLRVGEQGRRLVQELMDFARGEQVHMEPFDATATLEETCDALAALTHADGPSVSLHRRIERGLRVNGSAGQLHQILLNLGSNAIQALREAGGGNVHVSAHATVHGGRSWVRLSVRDDGPGIPDHVQPHLFEPFYSTRKGRGGTGLGLAIVERATRAHGGRLRLSSSLGKGTTFVIDLPSLAPLQASGGQRTLHLFAVDDDPGMRMLLLQFAHMLGHRISLFPRFEEALESARLGEHPDLLLTDLMDVESGASRAELVAEFRSCAPEVPIVLMTSSGRRTPAEIEIYLAARVDKPFSPEALDEVVTTVLGNGEPAPGRAAS